MSKIFKSYNVIIDENNRVSIKTNKIQSSLNKEKSKLLNPCNKIEKSKYEVINEINKIKEEAKIEIFEMKQKAKIEAKKMKDIAKLEAEKIKEEIKKNTEEECKNIKNIAKKEGYENGINSALDEAEKIKKDAILYSENLKNSLEEDIVKLISDIVEKILCNEIKINQQIISILVKNILYKINNTGNIKVKVSSADYEEIKKAKNDILKDLNNTSELEIIVDNNLKKADCIIETSFGIINCGLSSQYKEFKRSLYNILKIGD